MKLPLFPWAGMMLLVTGCSNIPQQAALPAPASVPTAERPGESPMVRGERITTMLAKESFGPLRLNEPEKEVLAALGEPWERSPIFHVEATGLDVQEWYYYKMGLTLRMASNTGPGGRKFVAAIYASAKCPWATRRGIRVGSTQAEAQQAYAGTEDAPRNDLRGPTDARFVVGSIFGGIVFEFTRGKVSGIFYGAYAECRTQPLRNPRG